MRGKAIVTLLSAAVWGITPAYAGKRETSVYPFAGGWDHPRLCGEKSISSKNGRGQIGSPPPMRGKDLFHDKFLHVFRITPAYAGKSSVPKGNVDLQ